MSDDHRLSIMCFYVPCIRFYGVKLAVLTIILSWDIEIHSFKLSWYFFLTRNESYTCNSVSFSYSLTKWLYWAKYNRNSSDARVNCRFHTLYSLSFCYRRVLSHRLVFSISFDRNLFFFSSAFFKEKKYCSFESLKKNEWIKVLNFFPLTFFLDCFGWRWWGL